MRNFAIVSGVLVLAACGGTATKAPLEPPLATAVPAAAPKPPTASAPAVTPPTLRLPAGLKPLHYALDLTLRPDADTFRGHVEIEVEAANAQPVVWLNADDLLVDEASFSAFGRSMPAKVVSQTHGFVGLAAEAPLPSGRATLSVSYHGKAPDTTATGIFRVEEAGRWYLLSKFESIFARKAFPGFDEPGWKTPFKITLHVPKGMLARSNSPIEDEKDENDDTKTVHFAETKPLPTYLVAWCVGPFDVLDAGTAGRKGTRVQLIVPAGTKALAGFAASAAKASVEKLEEYFDIPYPYDKLDLIAAPQYPGAMENAALILYASRLILIDPRATSIQQRRESASVIAHETAHMWFGDLVTTSWWDDIWLNEAFATWLQAKIVAAWQPTWQTETEEAEARSVAMGLDSLVSARQIRQPIASENDIFNSFDSITYEKGASVIAMFEHWIGTEKFRAGVHSYLNDHAFGNATSKDFFEALSNASGIDVSGPFSSFLDKPGLPEITAGLRCSAGKVSVALSQKRYLAVGAKEDSPAIWSVPVCARVGASRACTLLDAPQGELVLPDVKSCPAWLLPNAGGVGFYQARLEDGMQAKLVKALPLLALRERYAIANDLTEQVLDGRTPVAGVLPVLAALANDYEPRVARASVWAAVSIADGIVPDAEKAGFASWVRASFGKRAAELGWSARKGDDEPTKALRGSLLTLVSIQGQDDKLAAEGAALAGRWLDTRKGLDPDMRRAALTVYATRADAIALTRLRDEAHKTRDPQERLLLLVTIGEITDPGVLRQALAALLANDFNPRDAMSTWYVLGSLDRRLAPAIWAFVRQNLDALIPRFPPNQAGMIIGVNARLCDHEHAEELAAFFKDKAERVPGGPRTVAQTLERIERCVAVRDAQAASLSEVLGRGR